MNNLVVRVLRLCSQRRKERAEAAATVIRYLAAQPFIAKVNKVQYMSLKSMHLDGHPLSKSILQYLRSKNTHQEELKFFEDMFNPQVGVILPSSYIKQQRISLATVKNYQLGNQKQQIQIKPPKKFTFFPNRIITPFIFKMMYRFHEHSLLSGAPGISKTSNIIFFCYLANLITDYDFSYQNKQPKTKYADINRFIYVSFDPKNIYQQDILDNLNLQLPIQIRLKQFNQHSFLIRRLFKSKGLQGKVVFDQFNTIVAVANKYNNKEPEKKTELQRNNIQSQINLWFKTAENIFRGQVLYNSSINIEQAVLGKQSPQFIKFDLNHHQKIPRVQIDLHDFSSYSDRNWVQKYNAQQDLLNHQMVQIIFFQVRKQNSLSQTTLQKAKQLLRKELNSPELRDLFSLMTSLDIRESFQIFTAPADPQQLKVAIIGKLKEKQNKIVEGKIYKTVDYVKKLKDLNVPLMIYQYYKFMLEQKQGSNYWMQLNEHWKQFNTTDYLDKNLFRVLINQENKTFIRTILSMKNYLKYAEKIDSDYQLQLENRAMHFNFMRLNLNKTAKGIYVQQMIIKAIKKYRQVNLLDFKLSSSRLKQFIHFHPSIKGKKLEYHFQFLNQNNQDKKHYAAFPITKIRQTDSQNSPSIDLLVFKYSSRSRKFQLTSLDFKLTKNKTLIYGAATKMQKLWERLSNTEEKKELSTEQMERNLQRLFSNNKISSWEHIIVSLNQQKLMVNKNIVFKSFSQLNLIMSGKKDQLIKDLIYHY